MHAIVRLQRLLIQEDHSGALRKCDYISELSDTVQRILVWSSSQKELLYSSVDTLVQGKMLLDHLYAQKNVWVPHALLYIEACVQMSQIIGGMQILLDHLSDIFARIPEDVIELFLNNHESISQENGMSYDKYLYKIIIDSENISYREAEEKLESMQRQVAQFHIFLESFYTTYVYRYRYTLSPSQRKEMKRLFVNFWDIFSHNFPIPLDFLDENNDQMMIDPLVQEKILTEERGRAN